jgi:hypothetical protein
MSVAFGIALESEKWMQSLPENCPSQSLTKGVWDTLERLAEEKGLTKLGHFIIEDPEYYEEALEVADEFGDPEREKYRQEIQARFQEVAGQPEWFSSADASAAAQTMRGLVEHLRENPDVFSHLWTQHSGEAIAIIVQELEGFASFLDKVESRNVRFRFWME